MPDLNRMITQLELSVHTYWHLYKADLFTVAKVIDKSPREMVEVLGSAEYLNELRAALLFAGYHDPWPELGEAGDLHAARQITTLGLSPYVQYALMQAELWTLGSVLARAPDDLLDVMTWEEYQELRRRLIDLGYLRAVGPAE